MIWCENNEILIKSDLMPRTEVLKPNPFDDHIEKRIKNKLPYLNFFDVVFEVFYQGEWYRIEIEENYRWNGTNCLGLQHLPVLLDMSMIHDKLCRCRGLVKNNRKLSSIILREIGIASGVHPIFMYIAYFLVELYQKCRGW